MGFSQKQFDTENEELVDVEDEEEDEDDSEFLMSHQTTFLTKNR